MIWDDNRIVRLKKLWAQGLSSSQIAEIFGNTTRNAVIGKLHRLKLAGGIDSGSAASRRRYLANRKGRASKSAGTDSASDDHWVAEVEAGSLEKFNTSDSTSDAAGVVVPLTRRKSLLELTNDTCRWPIGDPTHRDFCFCGRLTSDDMPYCRFHAAKAYQANSSRRRSSATVAQRSRRG